MPAEPPEAARFVVRRRPEPGYLRLLASGALEDRVQRALAELAACHLVMPDGVADAADIFRFLARDVSVDTYVNVMDPYYPAGAASQGRTPTLTRRSRSDEVAAATAAARAVGLWRLDARQSR